MKRYSIVISAAVRIALGLAAIGAATAFAQYVLTEKKPVPQETQPAQPDASAVSPEEKSRPAKEKTAPPSETKSAAAPATPEPSVLAQLAWLEGCWKGSVNRREYREHWLPLRGNLMVGVSHTVTADKTQDFEFLRLEPRADGIYYIISPPGQSEAAFRLAGRTTDRTGEREDEVFVFVNPTLEFPQKISYRRATEGWLYASLDGKVKGVERQVIYPMRRINCESGEMLLR